MKIASTLFLAIVAHQTDAELRLRALSGEEGLDLDMSVPGATSFVQSQEEMTFIGLPDSASEPASSTTGHSHWLGADWWGGLWSHPSPPPFCPATKNERDCMDLAPKNLGNDRAKRCPGFSTCNCVAGGGGFLECLSGGVTERCSSCTRECDIPTTNRRLELDYEFRCGCYGDLGRNSEIDCVLFDFPGDCISGCDNGNVIPAAWRDACLCHFTSTMSCSPDKCFAKKACGSDEEPDECRAFCQSFFADFGGPQANCVAAGGFEKACPIEMIRNYGRVEGFNGY